MEAQIDTSRLPILVTVLPPVFTVEAIDEFGRQLNLIFEAHGACYAITDATRLAKSTATERIHVSAIIDDLATRGAILSECIVVSSPIVRGVITAYAWLRKKTNHPFRCVGTMEEAMAFTLAIRKANEAGAAPPAGAP